MSDTRCGVFYAAGQTWDSNGTAPGGWTTTQQGVIGYMETCGGDSGGPVYSGHLGYGIINGITAPTTGKTRNAGFGNSNVTCSNNTWYAGLAGQMSTLNVHLP